ncbi:protein of unknown function [Bifidobacterium commune]|uniref:DUF5067 domain-containing protein n=2 Tax=Bifidobacterium commune TaxID=1505727 RepID=A0A1C4H6U3_9BIFI|nr:protein of unknown function [Bifidobacterium commune]
MVPQPEMQNDVQPGAQPTNGSEPQQTPMDQMPQRPAAPESQPPMSEMPQQVPMGDEQPQAPMNGMPQAPMGAMPQQPMVMTPTRSGMAIAALVLGIVAIVMFWIPFIGVICGIAAIVTGVMSMRKINAGNLSGKNMAITGLVTGIVGLVISAIVLVGAFSMGKSILDEANQMDSSTSSDTTHEKARSDKGSTDQKLKDKEMKGSGSLKGGDVKIASAQRGPDDFEGHNTIIVTYEYTNTDKENHSFRDGLRDKVFQKGASLKRAYYLDDVQGYNDDSDHTELQPNGNLTVTVAYELNDETSPVDVEVSSGVDYMGKAKITKTFNLQ